MRKRIGALLCMLALVFSITGCKVESVEQHQANAGIKTEETKTPDTPKSDEDKEVKKETQDKKETDSSKKEEPKKAETDKKTDTKKDDKVEKPKQPAPTNDEKQPTQTPSKPNPSIENPKPVAKKYVTISIDMKTILNNMDKLKENKKPYVPADGWVLKPTKVEIQEGDSVFSILEKVTRANRIHMEYQGANQGIYNSVYIQGIHQLYEFDCGDLSGWMYSINGDYVSVGASVAKLKDGDVVKWMYSCDLGRDLDFKR